MRIIKPKVEFVVATPYPEKLIARMARICYQTEPKGPGQDTKLIRRLCDSGHTSQIEHATASFIVTCDRGVTHEWVRSRIGVAYSQESTRFCNYAQDRFDSEIKVVDPTGLTTAQLERRHVLYTEIEKVYNAEIAEQVAPQIARGVLPTSLKTQLGVTMDFRAWRWFLALRTSQKAHPQIRELAFPVWDKLSQLAPNVFATIPTVEENGKIREDVCLTRPEVMAELVEPEGR